MISKLDLIKENVNDSNNEESSQREESISFAGPGQIKASDKRDLDGFVRSFDSYSEKMAEIDVKCEEIERIKSDANTESVPYKEINKQYSQALMEIKRLFHEAKTTISEIEDQNTKLKLNKNSPNFVFRDNIIKTHKMQFFEKFQQFQKSNDEFNQASKSKIRRRARAVDPNLTEEELEKICESNNPSSFLQKELEKVHGAVLDKVVEIEERNEDMKRIEQGVQDIFNMFSDLKVLVDYQGEKLNSIENNILITRDNVEKGLDELEEAEKLQKSTTKVIPDQCR